MTEKIPGGCSYLVRGKRYCRTRATFGSNLCSKHRNPVDDVKVKSVLALPIPEGRKKNVNKRMKRMLNPFRIPSMGTPCWAELLDDIAKPLMLDIGCAKGGYLADINKNSEWAKVWNFVGVELFKPLVDQANGMFRSGNLVYLHANINKDINLLKLPNLQRVSFLFPDPWSCGPSAAQKNCKKRVMNAEFAEILSSLMPRNSMFYFCTDWLDLALDIKSTMLATNCFSVPLGPLQDCISHIATEPYIPTVSSANLNYQALHSHLIDVQNQYEKPGSDVVGGQDSLWLAGIPFDGFQTERDLVCETQWRAVYRLVLVRS